MSDRIRAGDILNEAFQFGLHRWTTVLRYLWLPLIVAAALVYGAIYAIVDLEAYQSAAEAAGGGIVSLQAYLRVSAPAAIAMWIAVFFIVLLLYSGAYASVFRLVALGEDRPGVAQLRFDGPAQRVFGAQLILTLINVAIWLAAMALALASSGVSLADIGRAFGQLIAMTQASAADPAYKPGQAEAEAVAGPLGALFLGFLFAAPLFVYVNVKLAPFLAGSAAENRLLLFGSFRMTKGHAWAIFGTYLLFMAAMLLLVIVFGIAMSVFDMLGGLSGGGTVGLVGKLFQAISFVLDVVVQVFMTGVALSLQAIIYRRLSSGE